MTDQTFFFWLARFFAAQPAMTSAHCG